MFLIVREWPVSLSWALIASISGAWFAMRNRLRTITIFESCLALLVLLDGISRLSVWPSGGSAGLFVNVLQLCLYALLVIDLVRRKYPFSTYLAVGMSAAVFLLGWLQTHDSVFIRDVLLIVAARDTPFEKTVHTMRITMSLVVCIGILTVVFGFVGLGVYRRGGVSLGFAHPNQLALMLTVIALMWLAERRKYLTGKDLTFATIWALVTYLITRSRTPLLLMMAVIILGVVQVRNPGRHVGKVLAIMAPLVPILCLLFTYMTAVLLPLSQFVNQLDLLLSNRIWLNWYAFSHYDITMFGQVIDLTAGTGTVYNEIRGVWNSSITVDNTYTLSLLSLGLIPTLGFVCWNTFSLKRAVNSGDFYLVVLGIVLCVYGITEAQMMDVYNNFVLLSAYSLSVGGRPAAANDVQGERGLVSHDS